MEDKNIWRSLYNIKKKAIKLTRDTKAFNYNYVTLSQIQEKLGPILEEENLVVMHLVKGNVLSTQIRSIEHEGFVSSEIDMSDGVKAQDKGSEITYFRRYNLLCLLDLETEDDDGKKASDSYEKKTQVKPKGLDFTEHIQLMVDEKDINHLATLWGEFQKGSWTDEQIATATKVKEDQKLKLTK